MKWKSINWIRIYTIPVYKMADEKTINELLLPAFHAKKYYAHLSNKCFNDIISFLMIWNEELHLSLLIVTVLNLLSVWFMQYKNYNDNVRTTLVRSTTCTNPQLKFRTCKSVTEYALLHIFLIFRWNLYPDSIMKNSSWIFFSVCN